MKIAITGSHGFIGSALAYELRLAGHHTIPIVREPIDIDHIMWNPDTGTMDATELESAKIDGVVHLAGVGIAERRWTAFQKQAIVQSRVKGTTLLCETLAKMEKPPEILVSASAVGYYGSRDNAELTETAFPGEDFLAKTCVEWEKCTKAAVDAGIKTAIIRSGIVLDPSGGALSKMLLPFKLGLGGRLGSGDQFMSWITLHDHIRAIMFILENKLTGPFNLVSPKPVTNKEFTKALGAKLHRPTIIPTPLTPLNLQYGAELVEQLLLASQRALPDALIAQGFEFHDKNLEDALDKILD